MSPASERLAICPGSFDPLTNGHVDIITRGARLFDRMIVAILRNAEKAPLFSVDDRIAMASDGALLFTDDTNGIVYRVAVAAP